MSEIRGFATMDLHLSFMAPEAGDSHYQVGERVVRWQFYPELKFGDNGEVVGVSADWINGLAERVAEAMNQSLAENPFIKKGMEHI